MIEDNEEQDVHATRSRDDGVLVELSDYSGHGNQDGGCGSNLTDQLVHVNVACSTEHFEATTLAERQPVGVEARPLAACSPKYWGTGRVLIPFAVVVAAVCLFLIQQGATIMARVDDFSTLGLPRRQWKAPQWSHCAAFDNVDCTSTALVLALSHSSGAERYLAAEVLSNCVDAYDYSDGKKGFPSAISLLVQNLRRSDVKTTAADAPVTVRILQSLLPKPHSGIDEEAAVVHLLLLMQQKARFIRDTAAVALRNITLYTSATSRLATSDAIPTLVRLLDHDASAVRAAAARVLYTCANVDHACRRAISATEAARSLVALLKAGIPDEQEAAVGAIAALALDIQNHQHIVEAGGVPALVQMLRASSPAARGDASRTVFFLTNHEQYKDIFVNAEAVPLLARLLIVEDNATKSTASGAIKNLLTSSGHTTALSALSTAASLVQLLREGSPALQEALTVELWPCCGDETARRVLAAARMSEPLVHVLKAGTDRAKEAAAGMLRYLATDAANRIAIAADGAIPELVRLLWEGAADAKQQAARALWNLAANGDNRKTIADAGAIPLLVLMLERCSGNTQLAAAGALGNLAVDRSNDKAIAAAGAIPLLVQLLEKGSDAAKQVVAGTLTNLSANDDNEEAIVQAGAIPLLVQMLEKGSEGAQREAAGALRNLAGDNVSRKIAVAAGAIPLLVQLLERGSNDLKQVAVEALRNLAVGEADKNTIAAAGAIPLLMQLLRDDAGVGAVPAVEILGTLALDADNRKALAGEGIVPVLQAALFNDTPSPQHVRLLCNLAEDPTLATQFVHKGFVPRLVQLAESEAPEVQKQAVWALEKIARSVPDHSATIVEAGAVTPLQKLRDGDNQQLKERAARVLKLLSKV
jgi:hypothetical protein